MNEREAFGPNLRRRRIRAGVSLEDIAQRTCVNVELWEGLERNDFSRWPTGVHARSFIRDYALAVGVDPDETVDDFCRGFPQGDRRSERLVRGTAETIGHDLTWEDHLPPGVTHDRRASPRGPASPIAINATRVRATAAVLDGAVILIASRVVTNLVTSIVPIHLWSTVGVVALLYYVASLILLGTTPGAWVVEAYLVSHPELLRRQLSFFKRLDKPEKKEPSFLERQLP